MRTLTYIAAIVLPVAFFAGCVNPKTRDAHLIAPQDIEVVTADDIYLVPDATEVDYVENLASTRDAYRRALIGLLDYYRSVGNATKLQWAQTELKTFDQMVHYRYIQPAEWMPAQRMATDSIEDADSLYRKAKELYNESGGMIIVASRAKLQQALNLFNELIQDYPTSDKIDDAAWRAAKIYEYLKNYELAAVYFQRTFQWNEMTPYPARFRAAKLLDEKLRMKTEALTLYRLAVQNESRYVENTEFAKERITELSEPEYEIEAVPEEAPAEEVQE